MPKLKGSAVLLPPMPPASRNRARRLQEPKICRCEARSVTGVRMNEGVCDSRTPQDPRQRVIWHHARSESNRPTGHQQTLSYPLATADNYAIIALEEKPVMCKSLGQVVFLVENLATINMSIMRSASSFRPFVSGSKRILEFGRAQGLKEDTVTRDSHSSPYRVSEDNYGPERRRTSLVKPLAAHPRALYREDIKRGKNFTTSSSMDLGS